MAMNDKHLQEFSDAFGAAVRAHQGEPSGEQAITAAERLVAAFAALPGPRGGNKRGRKLDYDHEWARARLIALASSGDGLPSSQAKLIGWLGDEFAQSGLKVPGGSTLKRMVSEFYGWRAILDEAAVQKYRASSALQETFESEEDYLQWHRLEDRLAQRFLHDEELQRQFRTPENYIASRFEDYTTRIRTARSQESEL